MIDLKTLYSIIQDRVNQMGVNKLVNIEPDYCIGYRGYSLNLITPKSNWVDIDSFVELQKDVLSDAKYYDHRKNCYRLIHGKELDEVLFDITNTPEYKEYLSSFSNVVEMFIKNIPTGGRTHSNISKGSVREVGVKSILRSLNEIKQSDNPKVTLYVCRLLKSGKTELVFNPAVVLRMIVEDYIKTLKHTPNVVADTHLFDSLYYFIAHETDHVLYGHVSGAKEYDMLFGKRLSNISMDAYINERINRELKCETIDSGIDGKMYCHVSTMMYDGDLFRSVPGKKNIDGRIHTPGLLLTIKDDWKFEGVESVVQVSDSSSYPSCPDKRGDGIVYNTLFRLVGGSNSSRTTGYGPECKYHGCFAFPMKPGDISLFKSYLKVFLAERKIIDPTDDLKNALKDAIKQIKDKIDQNKSDKSKEAEKNKDNTVSNDPGAPFKVGDIVVINDTGERAIVKGIHSDADGKYQVTIAKVEEEDAL